MTTMEELEAKREYYYIKMMKTSSREIAAKCEGAIMAIDEVIEMIQEERED